MTPAERRAEKIKGLLLAMAIGIGIAATLAEGLAR